VDLEKNQKFVEKNHQELENLVLESRIQHIK
jgi:hypothetical protein